MKRRLTIVLTALTAVLVSGCSSLIDLPGGGAPDAIYELYALDIGQDPAADWLLAIDQPTAPAALRTDRIAVKTADRQIQYIAGARWSDRLPGLVSRYMVESLEGSGVASVVGQDTAEVRGDYLLKLDIRDFSAYGTGGDISRVQIRASALVLETGSRAIIGHKEFLAIVPSDGRSIAATIVAFNEALDDLTGDVIGWLRQLPAPAG